MKNTSAKIGQAVFLLLLVYALCTIILGSYYSWPNLEAINESRAHAVGVWNAWSQALVSMDGRYTTNFLQSINPLVWNGMLGYKVMPLVGVLFLMVSCIVFFSGVFKPSLQQLLFVLLLVVVHFALSSSITYELFNMISSFMYLWGTCFWLIWAGASIRCYASKNGKYGNFWFLMAVIFLTLSTGTNEMFLVVNAITLALIGGIAYFQKSLFKVLPLLMAGVISILFFFACSGSLQRIGYESQFHMASHLQAETSPFFLHYTKVFKQVFTGSFLLFPVFLLIVISLPLKQEVSTFLTTIRNRLFVFVALLAIVFLIATPFYIFKGSGGNFPDRIFSTVTFFIELLGVFVTILLAPHLGEKIKSSGKLTTVVAFYLFFGVAMGANNYTGILKEWQSGAYEKFNCENYTSYNGLTEAAKQRGMYKFVEIEGVVQTSLLIHDPSTNFPGDWNWYNRVLEGYYLVDEVKLKSDTTSKSKILTNAICQ